ncbi:MAG TPA: hypothetical protein VND45_09300 [Thermoanaerobaculia bacterium]|jgi:hypothetical protein|nr:hypothetical protein [Thermoanaerobaculia bacterium]
MRFSTVPATLLLLFAAACADRGVQPDHQTEWRDVLRHKKAAVARDARPEHKQAYADSVRAFVQKHPDHGRAREVWQRLQLEFANDLAAMGRHQDSIRFYRAVLAHDPRNADANRGVATAMERLAVSREKLLSLEKGMSHRAVASILGKPMPGWSAKNARSEATFEAWYYRTRAGGVAAVYFRDGKVFAAEESSHAKLGRLGS